MRPSESMAQITARIDGTPPGLVECYKIADDRWVAMLFVETWCVAQLGTDGLLSGSRPIALSVGTWAHLIGGFLRIAHVDARMICSGSRLMVSVPHAGHMRLYGFPDGQTMQPVCTVQWSAELDAPPNR